MSAFRQLTWLAASAISCMTWSSSLAVAASASATDLDGDGVANAQDWCPRQAETKNGIDDEDGCPDAKPSGVVLAADRIEIPESVAFAPASARILAKSRGLLDVIAGILRDTPRIARLRVEGHTDNRGAERVNQKLSKARAAAVRRALMARGIAAGRLEAVGLGSGQPRADNTTVVGRRQNRRVDFIVAETQTAPVAAPAAPAAGAVVAVVRGEVTVVRPDGFETGATVGMALPNASAVRSGADGYCELKLPSGARLRVRSGSEIVLRTKREVEGGRYRSRVRLVLGTLWSKILGDADGAEQSYEVVTANAVAGVRGTVYQVGVADGPDGVATSASTFDGTVAFAAGGKVIPLEAGMGITALGDRVDGPHPLPPAPRGLQPFRGTFSGPVALRWQADDDLTYRVEVARDIAFAEIVVSESVVDGPYELSVAEPGDYFWRVRAVRGGLEGVASQLFRLTLE